MWNKCTIIKNRNFLIISNKNKPKNESENKLSKEEKISEIKYIKNPIKKFTKNNKTYNMLKESYILILLIVIFCLHFSLCFNNTKELRRTLSSSTIFLTVSQTGLVQLLSDDFDYLPVNVFLDSEEVTLSDKSYEFSDTTNIVVLFWDYPLTNLSSIFRGCSLIETV